MTNAKQTNQDDFSTWLTEVSVEKKSSKKSDSTPDKKPQVHRGGAPKGKRPGGVEATKKSAASKSERLTPQERRFCQEYIKTGKAGESVVAAGYNVSNLGSAGTYASILFTKKKIQDEIKRIQEEADAGTIADAREVMQYFTDVMRGKVKDQFGLEASLAERSKAAQEIAKRTVDIENRAKLIAGEDNAIHIKIDWQND